MLAIIPRPVCRVFSSCLSVLSLVGEGGGGGGPLPIGTCVCKTGRAFLRITLSHSTKPPPPSRSHTDTPLYLLYPPPSPPLYHHLRAPIHWNTHFPLGADVDWARSIIRRFHRSNLLAVIGTSVCGTHGMDDRCISLGPQCPARAYGKRDDQRSEVM